MKGLTIKQMRILNYIRFYIKDNKISPSIQEIANHFKSDYRMIYNQILSLERKDRIKRSNKWRSIEVIDDESTQEMSREELLVEIDILREEIKELEELEMIDAVQMFLEEIDEAREEMGKSKSDFSMDAFGKISSYSAYMSSGRQPSIAAMEKMAKAAGGKLIICLGENNDNNSN